MKPFHALGAIVLWLAWFSLVVGHSHSSPHSHVIAKRSPRSPPRSNVESQFPLKDPHRSRLFKRTGTYGVGYESIRDHFLGYTSAKSSNFDQIKPHIESIITFLEGNTQYLKIHLASSLHNLDKLDKNTLEKLETSMQKFHDSITLEKQFKDDSITAYENLRNGKGKPGSILTKLPNPLKQRVEMPQGDVPLDDKQLLERAHLTRQYINQVINDNSLSNQFTSASSKFKSWMGLSGQEGSSNGLSNTHDLEAGRRFSKRSPQQWDAAVGSRHRLSKRVTGALAGFREMFEESSTSLYDSTAKDKELAEDVRNAAIDFSTTHQTFVKEMKEILDPKSKDNIFTKSSAEEMANKMKHIIEMQKQVRQAALKKSEAYAPFSILYKSEFWQPRHGFFTDLSPNEQEQLTEEERKLYMTQFKAPALFYGLLKDNNGDFIDSLDVLGTNINLLEKRTDSYLEDKYLKNEDRELVYYLGLANNKLLKKQKQQTSFWSKFSRSSGTSQAHT